MQESVDISQEELEEFESVEDDDDVTQEDMEEVALRALGRITLQELINDSIAALVEVYKAKPESYAYDASHYDDEDVETLNPFMDLVQYLKELKVNESDRNPNP